ncbi:MULTISPECIES: TauD/TfdA family dioxygenase [unclassified Pseudomonas]|uniref:TauD/TfdA family dioxygenase n=1 Tax=unclassified Pseudomonas TaxID=196821 RepID=UPI002AC90896|nr:MULTISPECIES: TauD/TfdA family dioxygenase [unclassified Pseudomonas]MEB0039290.1 TauD/TfdA family dioxygenase [Pseudomonas sp. MH10]MEB0076062.1 TauD/TfdA family dioxygenase [Pseudomonas sp. MH10out]MEB0090832.1 TauD/TfdA family dioxygenase [Pseudomonas sp. CCI4.2]MEB0100137.1 TauD/TfdA family dioxygenase [Pseudomonas sp. CCI3.2]MEB0119729.1 TauD/TfdA family dioxygenase [Pseudomonas sp. CCI1.2]
MRDTYNGPWNWMASDMEDPVQWCIHLTPAHIRALDNALRSAKKGGVTLDRLTKENFPLSDFDQLIPEVLDRLENGRGVVVLRGLPALDYSKEELRLMYWGLGLYLGTGVSQSSKGDLLGDVMNFGADFNSSTGRGYMSKQALGFHSDSADVVVLMVLRTAMNGGVSKICSSVAIRNEIARTRPDLLEVLYTPFYWSWKGQQAPDEKSYYPQPTYSEHKGKFASRHIPPHVLSAHEDNPELGPLPDKQKEAMVLINQLANEPRFHFGMLFEPGDIQLLNNHVTMHSRSEFEDWPNEPERKRHLLRMWLSMPNTRELSPLMSALYQDQRGGTVRGGFPSRTGSHSFETVAAKD